MNRAKAIKAYCLECSGDSPKEVTLCQLTDCPLWPYRTGACLTSKVYKERMAKAKKNYAKDLKEMAAMA